ncbi:MAG: outer membrane protein assembly factor BamE [Maricaulaceae bacterium]|nr:outer membrane protein assembly factor BamE [Maricaulaceae bacterium]
MSRSLRLAAAVTVLAIGAAACNPTLRTHGFRYDRGEAPTITPAEDTRASLSQRLGNPSARSLFDDNTWYYVSSTRETLAYQLPRTRERRVFAVSFDDNGVVTDVREYGLEDGREVRYAGRETPTRGREMTLIEQLLGNVGRLPGDALGQDQDLPGGAGGPRRR